MYLPQVYNECSTLDVYEWWEVSHEFTVSSDHQTHLPLLNLQIFCSSLEISFLIWIYQNFNYVEDMHGIFCSFSGLHLQTGGSVLWVKASRYIHQQKYKCCFKLTYCEQLVFKSFHFRLILKLLSYKIMYSSISLVSVHTCVFDIQKAINNPKIFF